MKKRQQLFVRNDKLMYGYSLDDQSAVEITNGEEAARIIIEQDEQPTYWKECLLANHLYDLPSGWTVEYFCNHFKTMNPKFCSRCVKGVCPDWRACLIPSENAQGEPGTVATGTAEAEHANEEPVCISQFASAEEFYQAHIESKAVPESGEKPEKASKQVIDDTDMIEQDLHIYGIAYEMREGKSVIRINPCNIRVRRKGPSQAESESQTDLWNYLGNKINRHMKPLDDDFGIHPLLDLYGKSEFTITRKMKP